MIEEVFSSDFSLFGFGWKAQSLKLCQAFVDAETSFMCGARYFWATCLFKLNQNFLLS